MTEKSNAHSSRITSVGFSPDGKTIMSGSWDRALKVWGALAFLNCQPLMPTDTSLPCTDAATLSLVASQTDSSAGIGGIQSVTYSSDGSKIVSGAYSGTLKVWDAVNFRPHVESEWEQFWDSGEVEDEVEDGWRNKVTGQLWLAHAHEQATKPSGGAPLGH